VVEDPLDEPPDRHEVEVRADLAVEPEVDAGDRRGAKLVEACQAGESVAHPRGDHRGHAVERHRQYDEVGREGLSRPEGHAPGRPFGVGLDRADPGREPDRDAPGREPGLEPRAVELAERDERQLHPVAVAIAEEAVEEDLARVADVHPVEPLVQGRDQDRAPVPVDRPAGLAVAAEPRVERLARPTAIEPEAGEAEGDPQALADRQVIRPQEAPREVQGGGESAGLQGRVPPLGREEPERRLAAEEVGRADPAAEVGEVGAAGHADVLTVVDEIAGRRVDERAGPPAEPGAALDQGDVQVLARQADRRGEAGEPAADDHHPRGRRSRELGHGRPSDGRRPPTRNRLGSAARAIAAFFQAGRRTRPVRTS